MHGTTRSRACVAVATALAMFGATRSASAQIDSSFLSRLSIHGYLSVAYGISGDHPYLGLPTDGTMDYDRAAVLARFALAPSSHIVAQVAHRDLALEGLRDTTAPLLVDWAYFEQRFGDNTRLRVGQEPMPIGIYNEIRYVGTLLPFYRVSYAYYGEGGFTTENLQGAVLTQSIAPASAFPLELSVWAGQFGTLEQGTANTPTGTIVFTKEAEGHNAVGGFLWVGTPIQGLRAGAGIMHWNVQGGALAEVVGPSDETQSFVALDGAFDRFQVRSEWSYLNRAGGKIHVEQGYVQGGLHVLGPLTLNAQFELLHLHIEPGPFFDANVDLTRDVGLGLDYQLPFHSVFKLEGHLVRGYNDDALPPLTGAPQLSQYAIASLAVAF